MAIYFFDKNQTLIKIAPDSATFEAIQTQELDDDSLLKDTLSVTVKGDEKLLNAEYMAVKSYTGNAQAFDMYRIVTDTTPDKSMSFTGMSLAPYELNGHILQDLRPTNQTISYTLNRVLDGTDWRVGYIEDGLSNITTTFYYVSAKEALKELQSLVGCEFVFKVEISGQKITDKWIEVYSEMGNRTKKRFNYGTNALTVVRETNKADIYTALIGRGKGEEVSSAEENESGQAGYGRKITFEDIEWSTANGNPLDKPIGQYYLELPQATQTYGIKNIDGTMKARVGIVDFDDEEDKNRLINLTYQQLLVSSRPKVLFKTTVANIGATGIGDTVTIHRHDLNIHYQTRVRKIVRNKLNDNKTQIELGDAVVTASTKRAKQNNATIKSLNQEIEKVKADVTISQTSADGKNTINYGSAEPERKQTGDTWYRPHPSIAGETQMLTWNGTAWELVLDTSDLTSVSRAVEDAAEKTAEAVQAVKDADEKAEAIKQGLGISDINLTNQQITDQIKADYNTVKRNSTNALTDAGKALTDVYNAQQDADKIIEDFEIFLSGDFVSVENDIVAAQTTATDALNKAGTAVSDLDTFKNDYNTFITNQFNPAFTTATTALSLAEQNEGLFYSANLIDEVTGLSNVYTKAEIDGTNGYVTKATFKANAESLSSEFERIEGVALASGANINLLITRNQQEKTWLDASPETRTYPTPNDTINTTATSPDLISVTPSEKITLSKTTTPNDNYFRIDYLDADKKYVNRYTQNANVATITIPANVAYLWVSYPLDSYPKIERGEVKTQWTLAPQDQVNQSTVNYLTSKIEQTPEMITEALLSYTPTDNLDDTVSSYLSNNTTKTAGAIDTKLTSYAKTTDLNGLATETFAVNKATETANGVKNELIEVIGTKVDEDTLDGYVSTATYDEGVKGISRSISTVEGKIPTVIGGRNYLLGTGIPKATTGNVTLNDGTNQVLTLYEAQINGLEKTVTVSFDYTTQGHIFTTSSTATPQLRIKRIDDTYDWILFDAKLTLVYGNRKFVGKITNDALIGAKGITLQIRFDGVSGGTMTISNAQLENGIIPSGWTLAPEDLQTIDALDSNIVSLYNNASSETSKAISRTLTAYTPTSELDNKTKSYLTNNNYQTAEMVETKLTAYTPTTSLDAKTQTYLTSNQYQTASQVSTTLESYTKTIDLDNTVVSYLNNSSSQTAQYINNKLSAYTTDESFDTKTQSYLSNNSYQTAEMVETKLSDYQTKTTLDGTVARFLDNAESQTAGKINSKLTDIQAQIPTEFGGRNLLRGTADFDTYFWRNVSTAMPSTRDSRYKQVRVDGDFNVAPITTMSVQGWNFEVGKEYVISVWAKSEALGNKLGVTAQSNAIYFEPQVVALSEWRRYVWTFTATRSDLTSFRFETRNGERVWITQPQIEKGSIPTDWTRAVEDLATVVQTNEIERTANYTKSAITNVTASGLVTGSTVNQTKDGITERVARLDTNGNVIYSDRNVKLDSIVSTVANDSYISQIIQSSGLVQSTIRNNSSVDLLARMGTAKQIADDPLFLKGNNGIGVYNLSNDGSVTINRNNNIYGTQPTGSWRLTIVSSSTARPSAGGFLRSFTGKKFKEYIVKFTAYVPTGTTIRFTNNSLGTGGESRWLSDNMGQSAWKEYTYYVRYGNDDTPIQDFGYVYVDKAVTWYVSKYELFDLSDTSYSQITQLQDNINLKVSTDSLINQINVSAGGTLIQSGTNKLNITPETTYIEDATIKSAMIESLEAGKIKTGTLDAGKVKVINIDAENITTGKLKSINIVNTISYPSDDRTYTGDMTIAGGQISSYVTAGADYYKSIFINDRSIRLSNQNATLNMQAGKITFDGTMTGGGQIWYQDDLARLIAGSYNGFALASYRDGKFSNRISVGGWPGEELAPFVDIHTTLNMRYRTIENVNAMSLKTDVGKTGAKIYATGDNNLALGGTWGTVIGHLGSDGKTVYEFLKADQASDRVRFAKNINMQGNTILNQSDERLKHNIYDLERDDLSILKDIRYKNFTFNNQEKETFGFIAQDIQKIMPSLIMEETDGYLSYDSMEYTHFIGHALQQHVIETTTEIDNLKSQIASLQDELALLKGEYK